MKMENEKNSLIIEESSISYYSTLTNFRIESKTRKRPQNLFKSFSPLSCNRGISFSNTIMFPFITTETILDTTKDITKLNQDKSKATFIKDRTILKTEISKNDDNDAETKLMKVLIDTVENSDVNENCDKPDKVDMENQKQKNIILERNPFFQGEKYHFLSNDINGNDNNNRYLQKICNENIEYYNLMPKGKRNSCFNINSENKKKNKLKTKIPKTKSFNTIRANEIKNFERSKTKYHSLVKSTTDSKGEDNSIKTSKIINKEHNVKFLKHSLFNKNIFHKYKGKTSVKNNIRLQKEEKNINDRTPNKAEVKTPILDNKENSDVKVNKKKLNRKILSVQNNFSKTYSKELGLALRSEKKKSHIIKNKITAKKLNFEQALKKKENLVKTQYNLFSPEKFTNTEFCDSDYCDYTLNCMELILKKNKSQRQEKAKVNFNFPKSSKNKIKKKIALFDLDETLVHCIGNPSSSDETYQYSIEISLPGNKETIVGINIRPLWKKTLNLIKKHYYIVVFTASHQAYADAVLDFMDPEKKYFKYRLYRNNCSLVDVDGTKFYVKDLDIFDQHYDLKDIVIIDNSVLSFIYHLENGIPIVPYYNEDKDGALYIVGLYLMHIFKEDDLRTSNKKYINLDSFLDEARTRKKTESTFNESLSDNDMDTKKVNNDDSNNKINESNKSNNTPLHKILKQGKDVKNIYNNINNNSNNPIINIIYLHPTGDKTPQHKLITKSRLFNVYYEYHNKTNKHKMEEIIEKKSYSSEDENNYHTNDNRFGHNNKDLCFTKMMQTTEHRPFANKKGNKTSKGFCISSDLKKIQDTFDINFPNW